MANENLQDILNLVNKIRLLLPSKTIWLYSGFTWEECKNNPIRHEIVCKCDILVDDTYRDAEKDIRLKWRGSGNQRVIDVKLSLQKEEVVLYNN